MNNQTRKTKDENEVRTRWYLVLGYNIPLCSLRLSFYKSSLSCDLLVCWDWHIVGIGGSSIGGAVWDVEMLSGVVTLTDAGVPLGDLMGGLCGGTM